MENNRPTIESKSTDRRKRRISLLNDRKTQTKRGNLSTPLSDTTTSSLNRIDSSLSKNIQTGKSNPTKNPNISNETGQAKLAKAKVLARIILRLEPSGLLTMLELQQLLPKISQGLPNATLNQYQNLYLKPHHSHYQRISQILVM
jgi:hypothetical protein